MALTPAEAQTALNDIEKTENRVAAFQHGRLAAPYLFLWGVIWLIGYVITGSNRAIAALWFALAAIGITGSLVLRVMQHRAGQMPPGFGRRYFGSSVLLAAFIAAFFAINPPRDFNQASAVAPMMVGLAYCLVGIWSKGWRMLPLGIALISLTLIGFFAFPQIFAYWMAAVGGGGLILGGFWVRNV